MTTNKMESNREIALQEQEAAALAQEATQEEWDLFLQQQ